jgi:PAS domain S-box-containing protein
LVRDWANSSTNIILASVEEITYGKIMEINASCAALFGYEKHELLNQNISQFIPEDFRKHFSDILQASTNEETFLLVHKNGYLIAVSKNAKHYNSMSTGATALITF